MVIVAEKLADVGVEDAGATTRCRTCVSDDARVNVADLTGFASCVDPQATSSAVGS
jgi:hypothetical protein